MYRPHIPGETMEPGSRALLMGQQLWQTVVEHGLSLLERSQQQLQRAGEYIALLQAKQRILECRADSADLALVLAHDVERDGSPSYAFATAYTPGPRPLPYGLRGKGVQNGPGSLASSADIWSRLPARPASRPTPPTPAARPDRFSSGADSAFHRSSVHLAASSTRRRREPEFLAASPATQAPTTTRHVRTSPPIPRRSTHADGPARPTLGSAMAPRVYNRADTARPSGHPLAISISQYSVLPRLYEAISRAVDASPGPHRNRSWSSLATTMHREAKANELRTQIVGYDVVKSRYCEYRIWHISRLLPAGEEEEKAEQANPFHVSQSFLGSIEVTHGRDARIARAYLRDGRVLNFLPGTSPAEPSVR